MDMGTEVLEGWVGTKRRRRGEWEISAILTTIKKIQCIKSY